MTVGLQSRRLLQTQAETVVPVVASQTVADQQWDKLPNPGQNGIYFSVLEI